MKVRERGSFLQFRVHEMGTFFVKMVYKRVRGWTLRQSLPVQYFVEYPLGFLLEVASRKMLSSWVIAG